MKLKLYRAYKKQSYTIGKLYINGEYFCDTLEDTERGLSSDMTLEKIKELKVYGETAIARGTYKIILTYSPRFKKVLPLICNVKGYSGIRIHSGNTAKDTEGCILVGENKVKGQVINSRVTFNKLFKILDEANKKGEDISITII